MKIVCISDTHGLHDEIRLPEGDVLIHAGDLTNFGREDELVKVAEWMHFKSFKHKIMICGNHEKEVSGDTQAVRDIFESRNIKVLHNEILEIDGTKFYGEPRTPEFCNWGWDYMRGQEAEEVWAEMPWDTDVLITHGPPYGYGDFALTSWTPGHHVGCGAQLKRIQAVKPKYVICGHVHSAYGIHETDFETTIVNAAICTEHYKPLNKPIVIEI